VFVLVLLLAACGSRQTRAPVADPALKLQAAAARFTLVDERPAPAMASRDVLVWPAELDAELQARLNALCAGQGIELVVSARVKAARATELVDSRGEMTRIAVELEFETRAPDGVLFKRGSGHSELDIPRAEASDGEVGEQLSQTARDAFERYWASPATLASLNRELEAYARKRGNQAPATAPE
jgi:hypothetical protein